MAVRRLEAGLALAACLFFGCASLVGGAPSQAEPAAFTGPTYCEPTTFVDYCISDDIIVYCVAHEGAHREVPQSCPGPSDFGMPAPRCVDAPGGAACEAPR